MEDEKDQQENEDTHFQEQRIERTVICCRVLENDQRNMPHAGSIPKQVSQKNSAHLLAKKNSNAELHERTGMLPISLEVEKRRCRWFGHVNRMPPTSIPRVAMRWTPAGNRRTG